MNLKSNLLGETAPAPAFQPRSVAFSLPFLLPSLNERDRTNRWRRGKQAKLLKLEVLAMLGGTRWLPRPPFQRARITVTRCSSGSLDPDGLRATCKHLLDVLCIQSAIHPYGIGIIADDNARRIVLEVDERKAPPGHGWTHVRIEELET